MNPSDNLAPQSADCNEFDGKIVDRISENVYTDLYLVRWEVIVVIRIDDDGYRFFDIEDNASYRFQTILLGGLWRASVQARSHAGLTGNRCRDPLGQRFPPTWKGCL